MNITLTMIASAYNYAETELTMQLTGQIVHKATQTVLGNITDKSFKIDIERRLKIVQREQRAAEKAVHVVDAMNYLKARFHGTDANVFVNQTMPNVHLNGFKFYIVLDANGGCERNIALRFTHPEFTAEELNGLVSFDVVNPANTDPRNALVSGQDMNIERVVDLIAELAAAV